MGKKLFLVLLIPALVVLGGYLYLRFSLQTAIDRQEKKEDKKLPLKDTLGGKKLSAADLRPLLVKRLQQVLRKSSNGLYDLSIGDLKIDVLASTVSLQNVVIQPGSQASGSVKNTTFPAGNRFHVSVKTLVIEGINFDDVISGKTMDYTFVKLVHPVITMYHHKTPKKETAASEAFSQRFLKEVQKLSIKKLLVEDGMIIMYENDRQASGRVDSVQVAMHDILLDSATRKEHQRFFFAESATVSFHNYHTQTRDGLYHINIGAGSLKVPQQQVRFQNFLLASPLSKEQFQKRQKFRKELYHLRLSSIVINKVNWEHLLNGKELVADAVEIKGGKLSVYLDRSLPPTSRMGNFPNQLLMKLPLKMNIARLGIRKLDVSYTEYNPVSRQSGTIYLDAATMDMTNVSNVSKVQKPLRVKGSALFMHHIPLQTDFSFSRKNYRQGVFTANIRADKEFDGRLINSFAVPLGLVRLEKGTLQKLEAKIKGDQWQANGEVLVLYKDIKLSLLEKDQGQSGLDKKDITSFIANAFVLKKNNLKGSEEPRKENADFKRFPEAGFFMLVWKTVLVGALKTIGAPVKVAYKTIDSEKKE